MYKTLQCGFQKSGNYFLWRLIKFCQQKKGVFRSYIKSSGLSYLFSLLYNSKNLDLKFEEDFEVDETEINSDGVFISKDYPNKERRIRVKVDENLLVNTSSLIWTHSLPEEVVKIMPVFPFRFYIIRDGRDVVNSYIHFNCSPVMRRLNPDYKIDNPRELYSKLDVFRKYVLLWKRHVESYLKVKDFFIEVRFEKLVNFGEDFLKIMKLFGVEDFIDEAVKELSFSKLSKKNKNHLRKGKSGDWKNFFTDNHKEIFKRIAGDLLIKLGYEKDTSW